ncbi:carboxypeptidase S [Rhodofomes roseus]|uniref:Carboxypeptidase S n=1 Tax=Rhodofomes roseus TaxID=34475 RepID=A0ABQ8KA14_9APHY|nr:carboxypeptidase S [Rhodofomes roseus]KAH9834221.1 carboxypeptidase S [Rhodofomes roseus]
MLTVVFLAGFILYQWKYLPASVASISFFLPTVRGPASLVRWHESASSCLQEAPVIPVTRKSLWLAIEELLHTELFVNKTASLLSGAVRIPTEVYDVMGPVGEDPRWEAFAPLHEYLLQAFPLIHMKLQLTKMNTYGLAYVWEGSDGALKPLLLTAHQDVVPVDPATISNWTYPPYSGHYDGTRIWGRGSADDKNGLISILAAVETLLEHDFAPARTVVLAFGFDEEATGQQGAKQIGRYLLDIYGENAFAMLVDEGDPIEDTYGAPFARPAISEKGYFDLQIQVSAPGGHSSVPPPHTAIGFLSSLIAAYESGAPRSHLTRGSAAYTHAQCLAAHAPRLPPNLRADIRAAHSSDAALRRAEAALFAEDPALAAGGRTTVAVDVVWGGVKSNALPEGAGVVVNHRVAVDSSVSALKDHAVAVLRPVADALNVTLVAFPDDGDTLFSRREISSVARAGTVTLSDAFGTALEPAPVSPTDSAQWKVLAGTIRAAWGAPHPGLDRALNKPASVQVPLQGEAEPDIVVVPSLLAGNTDTQFYWALTPHIFRYNHYYARDGPADGSIHTVDEVCEAEGFVGMVKFFVGLMLNADESRDM